MTYTCPMHPEVKQDAPGQCPECGMNLVKIKDENEDKDKENKPDEHKHGGCCH